MLRQPLFLQRSFFSLHTLLPSVSLCYPTAKGENNPARTTLVAAVLFFSDRFSRTSSTMKRPKCQVVAKQRTHAKGKNGKTYRSLEQNLSCNCVPKPSLSVPLLNSSKISSLSPKISGIAFFCYSPHFLHFFLFFCTLNGSRKKKASTATC